MDDRPNGRALVVKLEFALGIAIATFIAMAPLLWPYLRSPFEVALVVVPSVLTATGVVWMWRIMHADPEGGSSFRFHDRR